MKTTDITKCSSWEDFDDSEVARERFERERRIDDYKMHLKGRRTQTLQNMITSFYDYSHFSELSQDTSNTQLVEFEKKYNIPVKTNSDLSCLTFAVGEKLQQMDTKEKTKAEILEARREVSRMEKRIDFFLKLVCAGITGFVIWMASPKIPQEQIDEYNKSIKPIEEPIFYSEQQKYFETAKKLFPLDQLSSDDIDYKKAIEDYLNALENSDK